MLHSLSERWSGNNKRSPCIGRRNVSRRLQRHLIAYRSSLRVIVMHVVVSALAFHHPRALGSMHGRLAI